MSALCGSILLKHESILLKRGSIYSNTGPLWQNAPGHPPWGNIAVPKGVHRSFCEQKSYNIQNKPTLCRSFEVAFSFAPYLLMSVFTSTTRQSFTTAESINAFASIEANREIMTQSFGVLSRLHNRYPDTDFTIEAVEIADCGDGDGTTITGDLHQSVRFALSGGRYLWCRSVLETVYVRSLEGNGAINRRPMVEYQKGGALATALLAALPKGDDAAVENLLRGAVTLVGATIHPIHKASVNSWGRDVFWYEWRIVTPATAPAGKGKGGKKS